MCETKKVIFEAIKLDILRLLEPVSETLQEVSLLTPKPLFVKKQSKFRKAAITFEQRW